MGSPWRSLGVTVAVAVTACSFDSRAGTDATPGDDAVVPDAGDPTGDGPAGDGPEADGPAAAFCDAGDADLIACYRFDGNTVDGSQYANDATTATGVSFAPGQDALAIVTAAGSAVQLPEDQSLDPPALTIELWLRPDALPSAGRIGLLDNDQQYSLWIYPDGIECFVVSTDPTDPYIILRGGTLTEGTWSHFACTYDGATLTIYKDGGVVATRAGTGPIRAIGTSGTALAGNNPTGEDLVGAIDSLRLWRVERSAAQICAAAGC